ncbi:MAG TPA: YIP1 family protein [Anaerolineae bacterium]|nr:YIP1 family protein [Anaerolineae bacterium]HMR66611.1 YIP1 family protein [Anaerolineae bacterium]
MFQRIIGVLKLDVNTFESIEHDQSATGQAAIIVTVVAILAAIGSFFGAQTSTAAIRSMAEQFGGDFPTEAVAAINPVGLSLSTFIGVFVSWLVWSLLTYLIGTALFKGQATVGEMLRVLGFAQAPQLLRLFSFIPCLGAIISLVAAIWTLVAGFIAVRQGLDISNGQTVITVVLSWLVAVFINICVLGPIFGLLGGALG